MIEIKAKIPLGYYFLFCFSGIFIALLGIYLVLSCFNKLTFAESFETKLRKGLSIPLFFIIAGGLSAGFILISDKVILKNQTTIIMMMKMKY